MRVKICGITTAAQAVAIADLGATALGFICAPSSPRYVTPLQIQQMTQHLTDSVDRIGVFVDSDLTTILATVSVAGLTAVQLHGAESPEFCQQLAIALPELELIKAFRIRSAADLVKTEAYATGVTTFLLDAYHPTLGGGTGQTLDWQTLRTFSPRLPWFLAGGLTPENVTTALTQLHPDGIDLSSGVEHSPGHKDLQKVERLITALRQVGSPAV